jgi:hypothetical protein
MRLLVGFFKKLNFLLLNFIVTMYTGTRESGYMEDSAESVLSIIQNIYSSI